VTSHLAVRLKTPVTAGVQLRGRASLFRRPGTGVPGQQSKTAFSCDDLVGPPHDGSPSSEKDSHFREAFRSGQKLSGRDTREEHGLGR